MYGILIEDTIFIGRIFHIPINDMTIFCLLVFDTDDDLFIMNMSKFQQVSSSLDSCLLDGRCLFTVHFMDIINDFFSMEQKTIADILKSFTVSPKILHQWIWLIFVFLIFHLKPSFFI